MVRRCVVIVFLLAAHALAAISGCQGSAPRAAPAEAPEVPVSKPVSRQVTDYVDFTGRTDAVQAVDVRARVTGYLVQMPFKEGAEVKQGDLLFEVDPRPYQAQLDQARGQVTLYQARLKLARTTYARYKALYASEPGAVSKQELPMPVPTVTRAEDRPTCRAQAPDAGAVVCRAGESAECPEAAGRSQTVLRRTSLRSAPAVNVNGLGPSLRPAR
jgi:multidrug efflux pump subunit AcrA (membrane-fusion protein)